MLIKSNSLTKNLKIRLSVKRKIIFKKIKGINKCNIILTAFRTKASVKHYKK
jgi:hypothetical protein